MPEDATRHLQQLLLEGIATGSVSVGVDVERLVCSTFAAHQQASCGQGGGRAHRWRPWDTRGLM